MQSHITASSASPVPVKTWLASVPKLLIGAFFLSASLLFGQALSGGTTKYDELMKTGRIEYENKNYAAAAELFAEAARATDNGYDRSKSLEKLSLSARLSGDPVRARIAHERGELLLIFCLEYWLDFGEVFGYCPVPDEDWAEVPPPALGNWEDCALEPDPDLIVRGCTAVILSGHYSGKDLAVAYYNRGIAYGDLGEFRQAIEDYDEALRIDPGYAKAYNNRAFDRCNLGQVETSLDDWGQVLRLGAGAAEGIQRHLRDRGFYKGAINGDFDPASQKALREWTVAGCP